MSLSVLASFSALLAVVGAKPVSYQDLGFVRPWGSGRQRFAHADSDVIVTPASTDWQVSSESAAPIDSTLSVDRLPTTKSFAPRTWQSMTSFVHRSAADELTERLVKFAESAVAEILNRTKRFFFLS